MNKNYAFEKVSSSRLIEKSVISSQFVKVYEELRKDKKFNSDAEFCEYYGYSKSTIVHIKKGRQDVSMELLFDVVMDWKVNPYFIFGLSQQVFL
jgi:hypothetical protein